MNAEENNPKTEERSRSRERDRNQRTDRSNRDNSESRDRSRDRDSDRGGSGNRKISDRRIYVSNIPYDFRWQDLKDLFRTEVGKVAHVELFTDENDKPRGCGIVEFEDADSVKVAVEKMYRYDIKGRKLVVKKDYDVERDKYGRLTTGRNNDNKLRDDRFRDGPRMNSGGRMGGSIMGGGDNKWGNTYGLSTQFLESLGISPPLSTRVFVANLDYKVDDKKLHEVFKIAGKIINVELGKDKDGKSRGFGCIEYDHPVESVQAISMLHNQQLYDRRMTVRLDRANEPDAPPKLPEGLKGLGMGLGPGGNRLLDVARNIPNVQNNPSNQMAPIMNPSPFAAGFNNVPAQLASALNTNAALQASLAGGLGANLATSGLLNANLTNDLTSNLGGFGGVNSVNALSTLQALNAQNAVQRSQLSKMVDAEANFSNNAFGVSGSGISSSGGGGMSALGAAFGNSRDFDSAFGSNRGSGVGGGSGSVSDLQDRSAVSAAFATNISQASNRGNSNGNRPGSDTIVIQNLPSNTTWQMLRDKCQDIGDVKFAEMRTPEVGLVRFASEWDAERAVSMMHRTRIDGRTIEVRLF